MQSLSGFVNAYSGNGSGLHRNPAAGDDNSCGVLRSRRPAWRLNVHFKLLRVHTGAESGHDALLHQAVPEGHHWHVPTTLINGQQSTANDFVITGVAKILSITAVIVYLRLLVKFCHTRIC